MYIFLFLKLWLSGFNLCLLVNSFLFVMSKVHNKNCCTHRANKTLVCMQIFLKYFCNRLHTKHLCATERYTEILCVISVLTPITLGVLFVKFSCYWENSVCNLYFCYIVIVSFYDYILLLQKKISNKDNKTKQKSQRKKSK